jgi:hypothetical protein
LLAAPRRRKLLDAIWQHTSLSRAQFARLYQRPLERAAELAQHFPASENPPQASDGWLTQDTLWRVSKTVSDRLRANFLAQRDRRHSGEQRDALRPVAGSRPPAAGAGPHKTHRLHGYLLKDPKCLFDDVPPNNPHLSIARAGQDSGKAA